MAIDPIESFGNYILVDHLDGTFGVYGHLKYGSLKVQVGQMVKPGEVLAAIGASGSSLMPHLHFEMINSPQYKLAEGLPIYFKGIKVEGVSNHHSQLICPDSGDFVWVDK
jgi:murein DD-endopeptidase MepM/ murein hydrolase activator NlpD